MRKKDLYRAIAKLAIENEQLDDYETSMMAGNDKLIAEIDSLRNIIVELKAENERLNYEFREMGIQCGRLEAENERLKGAIASALHRSREEEWGPVIDILAEALIYPKKFEDALKGDIK